MTGAPPAGPNVAALDVDARLLHIAYERLLPSLVMTLAVTAIFMALLWDVFSPATRTAWVAALAGSVLLRFALWDAFRRAAPTAASLPLWRHLFTVGSALAGLAWASGPALAIFSREQVELALFSGTLLSVSAVAMTSQAALRGAMEAFIVAAMAPVVIALFATDVSSDRMVGTVLLAGMIAMLLVGRASSAAMRALLEAQLSLRASVADADAARAQAEAASLAKTRFLANMSHELRTPLNAVIGAAQLLRLGQGGGERNGQLVDAIQRGGTHLLGLIEGILDLSRIEAGEMALQTEDFHLVECVEAAVSTAAVAAAAKDLRLACIVAPELPAWRHGDANRLRQTVLNLLGNAVKFTDRGEVVVRVQPGAAPQAVHISITDTGMGIAPESLPHIFEPFRQAEENADRRFGGSGLGLAIVKELVEAMGGRVGVTSELGGGSTFAFELPLPPALRPPQDPRPVAHGVAVGSAPPQPAREPPATGALQEMPRVLLVEDDPLNRTIVAGMLDHAGYLVSLAEDGPTALKRFPQLARVDLVLMDWQMPGMDGLETTRRLRSGEAGPAGCSVPIVGLTANAFAEDKARCLAAGMDDYLTKPVLSKNLLAMVERWSRTRGAPAAVGLVPELLER